MQQLDVNEIDNYSLFNDIENPELRARNRGIVLANIAMDHQSPRKEGSLTATGTAKVLDYFGHIPMAEREMAMGNFMAHLKREGFEVGV